MGGHYCRHGIFEPTQLCSTPRFIDSLSSLPNHDAHLKANDMLMGS
jgi:hypothetical protein